MDLYKKNFTKILGINGQKKAYNRLSEYSEKTRFLVRKAQAFL